MSVTIHTGDCLDVLATMADDTADLVLTDPPYFKVKDEPWDRQWDKPAAFLAWLDTVLAEVQRVMKPNGSLYLFASPRMAARVECLIAERFSVLNRITWRKPPHGTKAEMFRKSDLHSFFPVTEAIIFAEHQFENHGEPLRAYLESERVRSGTNKADCNEACGFSPTPGGMASRHYFSRSQWCLPTEEHYKALQALFNRKGGEYLRRDYEELRRPFEVSADVPYTDVWEFPTVAAYPGKHPCEKPVALLEHIIRCSARPGALVLDCFAGSGATGAACINTGRDFIGVEKCERWARRARLRLEHWRPDNIKQARARITDTLPLFAD